MLQEGRKGRRVSFTKYLRRNSHWAQRPVGSQIQPLQGTVTPRNRGMPHPCPSCPPSQGTCTEGPHGRSSADPGSWGPQKGGRNWGRWCCAAAPHSPHLRVRRDTAAHPERGTLLPSQRRNAAGLGRGGAGSGSLSMPPRRPCAGGHTCR